MSLTERDLQLAIVAHWRSSLVCACPNYTPRDWWECDVWGVTKAGYFVEWECKLSREDFKADARKIQDVFRDAGDRWTRGRRLKSDAIVQDDRGPSRFWYVVPDELELAGEEMPPWAGLATVKRWSSQHSSYHVAIIKQAPQIGRRKVTTREIRQAQRRMWYRYWECLRAMNRSGVAEPIEEAAPS